MRLERYTQYVSMSRILAREGVDLATALLVLADGRKRWGRA